MEIDIGQIALELTSVQHESQMQVSIRIRRSLDLECRQKLAALCNDVACCARERPGVRLCQGGGVRNSRNHHPTGPIGRQAEHFFRNNGQLFLQRGLVHFCQLIGDLTGYTCVPDDTARSIDVDLLIDLQLLESRSGFWRSLGNDRLNGVLLATNCENPGKR